MTNIFVTDSMGIVCAYHDSFSHSVSESLVKLAQTTDYIMYNGILGSFKVTF